MISCISFKGCYEQHNCCGCSCCDHHIHDGHLQGNQARFLRITDYIIFAGIQPSQELIFLYVQVPQSHWCTYLINRIKDVPSSTYRFIRRHACWIHSLDYEFLLKTQSAEFIPCRTVPYRTILERKSNEPCIVLNESSLPLIRRERPLSIHKNALHTMIFSLRFSAKVCKNKTVMTTYFNPLIKKESLNTKMNRSSVSPRCSTGAHLPLSHADL